VLSYAARKKGPAGWRGLFVVSANRYGHDAIGWLPLMIAPALLLELLPFSTAELLMCDALARL